MPADAATTPGPPTLQHFSLDDLAVYTAEQAFDPTASPDFRVFYVGRDDVHGVLMGLVQNAVVMDQVTLDRSQAAGPTEKAILASDAARLDYEYAVAAAQKRPVLAAAAAPAKAGLATPRLD